MRMCKKINLKCPPPQKKRCHASKMSDSSIFTFIAIDVVHMIYNIITCFIGHVW